MKIAVILKAPKNRYSGGRIYAYTIIKGLLSLGHRVTIYSNNKPIFFDEILGNLITNVNFKKTSFIPFILSSPKYDLIIAVPHRRTIKNHIIDKILFYNFIIWKKKVSQSKLWFINFETPNWIFSLMNDKNIFKEFQNSNLLIKHANKIISISRTGEKYAKDYYSHVNSHLSYDVLYPPINTITAEKIIDFKKDNSFIFFTRFDSNNKGAESIEIIIKSLPKSSVFKIISNFKNVNNSKIQKLYKLSSQQCIKLKLYNSIKEIDKFQLLAKSEILFFSSKFEGFGLPPVEAQYMNTKVIASDLEVLREINPDIIFDNFKDIKVLKRKIQLLIKSPNKNYREKINKMASFNSLTRNLKNIL